MPRYCSHCGLPLGASGEHPGTALAEPPAGQASGLALGTKSGSVPGASAPGLAAAGTVAAPGSALPLAPGAVATTALPKGAAPAAPTAGVAQAIPSAAQVTQKPSALGATEAASTGRGAGASTGLTAAAGKAGLPASATAAPGIAPPAALPQGTGFAQPVSPQVAGPAFSPQVAGPAGPSGIVAGNAPPAPGKAPPAPDKSKNARCEPTLDKPPPASPDAAYYQRVLDQLDAEIPAGEIVLLAIDRLPPEAGDKDGILRHVRSYSGHFALLEKTKGGVTVLAASDGAAHPGAMTEDARWLLPGVYPYERVRERELAPTNGTRIEMATPDWERSQVRISSRRPMRTAVISAGRRGRPSNDASMSLPPQTMRQVDQTLSRKKAKEIRFALAYHA